MKNSTYIEKKWMQFKVSALSASITALVVIGIPTQISASDIDIYQSGGTGAINIYFMLDTSGSMGNSSLAEDYQHTSAKTRTEDGYSYNQSDKGAEYVVFASRGNVRKDYNRVGKSYIFVGNGLGNYYIWDARKATNWDDKSDRYNIVSQTVTLNIEICATYNTLSQDLKSAGGYNYASSGDNYCMVSEGDLKLSDAGDIAYLNKIKKICEPSAISGSYSCLTRLANLKKGLLSLINSSEVDNSKYFAVGQYSGVSSSNLTNPAFLSMNATNKAIVSQKIAGLNAGSTTPIGNGYERATSQITSTATGANNAKPSCTGNGIYLLTDGEPTNSSGYAMTSGYSNWSTNLGNTPLHNDFWKSVGSKAIENLNGTRKIKTATVGFGGMYYLSEDYSRNGEFECSVYKKDDNGTNQSSMCYWGTKKSVYGQGGFYNAQSAEDIVGSIKQFVSDVSVPIEGSTMGTSTIPVDALNTTQLQPYSYFPMFKPLIDSKDQLWAGNLKKFKVTSGTIVDTQSLTVFENDKIRAQLQDYWYSANGSSGDDQFMTWGGHLSRLKTFNLPKSETSSTTLNRNLYIDVNGELKKVTDVLNSNNKPTNSQYLYGLMGFSKLKEADFTALGDNKTYTQQLAYLKDRVSTASGYQMGAVIHSTPVLLTQKGAIEVEKGVQSSKDREDYIMFGTTQGVLHIVKAGQQNTNSVDAEGGKDVFSFVPNEFLTRQSKGFAESLAMGRTDSVNTFFYGIDGPWVAHTVYEPSITDFYKKDENGNDVIENGQKVIESTRGSLVVKADSKNSHQYVYGGLRMGGRSYYALNLSDMSKPKLMFHVNPDASTLNTDPLYHMGQSWSQPTLTYIKWNGEKKLAMIVGGGYDTKYENPTFMSNTSGTVKGNGVYIFDAENGKLLWWGSSSVTSASQAAVNSDGAVTKPESTTIGAMVNSIPSRVKAIDRDGDGITDHLYVGDLGGKLFRIDLNPKHAISEKTDEQKSFILNAFTLADIGSRRFYEAPTFTIHKSGMTRYAVLSMGSGDRSSPLLNSSSNDLLVGIYDTSVTKTVPTDQPTVSLGNLREIYKKIAADATHKGWYYTLPKLTVKDTTYQQRILEEGVALDNSLYYPIFNPQSSTANVDATSCTGGITGESTLYQFCLPSGECVANQDAPKSGGSLGSGILGLAVGPGSGDNKRTFIFSKNPDPIPDEFETLDKLLPQRWFEYSPYKVKGDK
ncbi:pilus assembly protein [Acinetobacter johnsonii]|uniref:pilus assembly protein n=1 Tax=Acinetobacter johnsonii TaxID=40214 RepID=UPI002449170F|nr:PilC/PilY family type IV pilus protein [Acinetobacter johnsonii]MDH1799213.1 PilC/PilY family type IV pilus protein [Acinetobacter johnsonii]